MREKRNGPPTVVARQQRLAGVCRRQWEIGGFVKIIIIIIIIIIKWKKWKMIGRK